MSSVKTKTEYEYSLDTDGTLLERIQETIKDVTNTKVVVSDITNNVGNKQAYEDNLNTNLLAIEEHKAEFLLAIDVEITAIDDRLKEIRKL